jgi:hypothetical protein
MEYSPAIKARHFATTDSVDLWLPAAAIQLRRTKDNKRGLFN